MVSFPELRSLFPPGTSAVAAEFPLLEEPRPVVKLLLDSSPKLNVSGPPTQVWRGSLLELDRGLFLLLGVGCVGCGTVGYGGSPVGGRAAKIKIR